MQKNDYAIKEPRFWKVGEDIRILSAYANTITSYRCTYFLYFTGRIDLTKIKGSSQGHTTNKW